ncbi:hypothetical protein HAV15_002335 [Penicillium sp. str. |nr:hypothetical protein HAV15_002335 [Penicillium sp. str. \
MDYSMEDTQNSAPDAQQASKLNPSGQKSDTQSVTKRLQAELMQLMLSPSPGISAFPDADGNLLSWTATITGPTETPYEGLTLKLSFAFPNNYPYSPPNSPLQDSDLPPQRRLLRPHLPRHPQGQVERRLQRIECFAQLTKFAGASPLNAQAAELWDSDQAEFKRHVLARHQDLDDE